MYAASHENARRRAFHHQQQRSQKRANDLAAHLAERQRKLTVEIESRSEWAPEQISPTEPIR